VTRQPAPNAPTVGAKAPATALSRRAILGAATAGFAMIGLPPGLRAGTADGRAAHALAFDDGALIVARGGLRRSDDGGRTWAALASPDGGSIRALATHPGRPGRIFAGLETGGLAVSEDGGRGWEPRGAGLPAAPVTALTVAAARPDTLYAAVAGDGLWRSEDAGEGWQFVMDRPWLHEAERDVHALASVNLASGMGGIWLYAGTETGLSRVPDCFCRWQDVVAGDAMDALVSGTAPAPEAPLPAGEAIHALVGVPDAPERLFAALDSGIWASSDAGVAWKRLSRMRAAALAASPTDPDHIVAATAGGLLETHDGGATWSAMAIL
jgi:photosystem II stability/assembly factor-like uncharacterized protein